MSSERLTTKGFATPRTVGKLFEYPISKIKPWPHQRAAYSEVVQHDARMLYMKMATGKSKIVVDYLATRGNGYKHLILAPLYLVKHVWPQESTAHSKRTGFCLFLWKGSVHDRAKVVREAMHSMSHVAGERSSHESLTVVINYEAAQRGELRRLLLDTQWDTVTLDESHRIKGATSSLNRFCTALGKRAGKRICLTGTPSPHSPLDWFGQMKFLAPTVLGTNWGNFKEEYAVFDNWGAVVGYKNLKRLAAKVAPYVFYCDHSVFQGTNKKLPKRLLPVVLKCELTPKVEQIYRSLERSFVAQVGDETLVTEHTFERIVRMQQMVNGFLPMKGVDKQIESSKRDLLYDTLSNLEGEPVVVFCRYMNDIRTVLEVCRRLKFTSSVLTGHEDSLVEWQKGETDVIAVQVKCGDAGLDLTRSSTPIFYGLPKSPGDYDQCLHRFIRPTSKHGRVRPIHLIVKDTIDEVAYQSLLNREDLVAAFTKKLLQRKTT